MQFMPQIVRCTNASLQRGGRALTSTGEILKFLGVRIVIALNPRKSNEGLRSYWNKATSAQQTCRPVVDDFSHKFDISYHRFKTLNDHFRLDTFDDDQLKNEPYKPIDAFIGAFNDRREQVVSPGHCIVPDECMSPWKGIESHFNADPTRIHITKIPRKIQKGAGAPLQQFQAAPSNIPFHCAVVLRTVLPWIGTGRVVIADAAFSSLLTCLELLKRGLFFIGVVKGCTKGFPVNYVQDYQNSKPERGKFKVITTDVKPDPSINQTKKVMAVLHCIKHGRIRSIIAWSTAQSYPTKDDKKN